MLHDPLARTTIDLIKVSLDETKDKLVAATGDETLRLQGAALLLKRLHSDLTRAPLQPKEQSE